MGQTALFVHGTGVRSERFATLFAQVERVLSPRYEVRPCYWGDHCGANLDDGLSIPDYPPAAEVRPVDEAAWEDASRWSILEFDPLYELRILGMRASDHIDLQPGHPGADLRRELHSLAASDELCNLLEVAGYVDHWSPAQDELIRASELARALSLAEGEAIAERRAGARAWVASRSRSD